MGILVEMEFNPDPSKQATGFFTPNHLQLMFNGSFVAKLSNQKHLGLILDS